MLGAPRSSPHLHLASPLPPVAPTPSQPRSANSPSSLILCRPFHCHRILTPAPPRFHPRSAGQPLFPFPRSHPHHPPSIDPRDRFRRPHPQSLPQARLLTASESMAQAEAELENLTADGGVSRSHAAVHSTPHPSGFSPFILFSGSLAHPSLFVRPLAPSHSFQVHLHA